NDIWSPFEKPPNMMGHYLRPLLGADLVIIGSVGTSMVATASIDADDAKVGLPLFAVDLRASRGSPASAWLADRQTLGANMTARITLSPVAAFAALVFLGPLTPAKTESTLP